MTFKELLLEKSKDWGESFAAAEKIVDIYLETREKAVTSEDIKKVKDLLKISGRAWKVYPTPRWRTSVGALYDEMIDTFRENELKQGKEVEFNSRVGTAKAMAKQIGAHTKGEYTWKKAIVWTSGRSGIKHKDPEDHISYENKEAYIKAWEWVKKQGKQIHYKDSMGYLSTGIQIGNFFIEQQSTTSDAFGKNPNSKYYLSIRSISALKGSSRSVQDISDKEAEELQNIAKKENLTNFALIKLILKVLGDDDKESIKNTIKNTDKLDPKDKDTLTKALEK